MHPVISYAAQYLPEQNRGEIKVLLQQGGQPVNVPVNTDMEFIAVLAMLRMSGVAYNPQNAALVVGPRPAGT